MKRKFLKFAQKAVCLLLSVTMTLSGTICAYAKDDVDTSADVSIETTEVEVVEDEDNDSDATSGGVQQKLTK